MRAAWARSVALSATPTGRRSGTSAANHLAARPICLAGARIFRPAGWPEYTIFPCSRSSTGSIQFHLSATQSHCGRASVSRRTNRPAVGRNGKWAYDKLLSACPARHRNELASRGGRTLQSPATWPAVQFGRAKRPPERNETKSKLGAGPALLLIRPRANTQTRPARSFYRLASSC